MKFQVIHQKPRIDRIDRLEPPRSRATAATDGAGAAILLSVFIIYRDCRRNDVETRATMSAARTGRFGRVSAKTLPPGCMPPSACCFAAQAFGLY